MGLRTSSPITNEDFNQIFNEINYGKQISRADFKILSNLSQKDSSSCWLVEKIDTKDKFCMKIIDKYQLYNNRRIKGALKELKIISQINHPFIIKVFYAFQDYNSLYLITEYIKGGDLNYQREFHKSFSEEQTRFIVACLIQALEYLHNQGIILVGLTLEHILLDEKGYPRIIGFMESFSKDNQKDNYQDALNNELITEYLAPEVLMRLTPGIETDFYSLGIIMYEMMIGKKAIGTEQLKRPDLIQTILSKAIQVRRSDLPEGWQLPAADFLNKLIQKKPINRLGYYGAMELKKTTFFQNFQWQKIEQKPFLQAPFQPRIKKAESNFIFEYFSFKSGKQYKAKKDNSRNAFSKKSLKLIRSLEFQEQFESYYYSSDNQQLDSKEFTDYSQNRNGNYIEIESPDQSQKNSKFREKY